MTERKVIWYKAKAKRPKICRLSQNIQEKHFTPVQKQFEEQKFDDLENNPENISSATHEYPIIKENILRSWSGSRELCQEVYLDSLIHKEKQCLICYGEEAIYRCNDCKMESLCLKCLEETHSKVGLHIPEKWNGKLYEDFYVDNLFAFQTWHTRNCSGQYLKLLTLFDSDGRVHRGCRFTFCSCKCEISQLYNLGFWPTNPTKCFTAIDVKLLRQAHAFQIEGGLSTYGFCNSLKWMGTNKWLQHSDLYRYMTKWEAFHEFIYVDEKNRNLGGDSNQTCPCCYKNPTQIYILDGHFSAVHKRSAAKTEFPSRNDILFLNKDFTDEDLATVKIDEGCQNFRAGDYIRSKEVREKLDIQGIFGVVCRHEFWRLLIDMITGERYCYAVSAIEAILSSADDSTERFIFVYDIACKLKTYLSKRPVYSPLLEKIDLVIDQFHSYGHVQECQLFKSIRSTKNVGLTCGSGLERQWPQIRRTSTQTKEMSLSNRRDFITATALHQNKKRLMTTSSNLVKKWKETKKVIIRSQEDIDKFRLEIDESLTENEVESFVRFERSNIIPVHPSDRRLKVLKQLQGLAQEREFLLNSIRRYPIGQKVNLRLNKQIKRQEKLRIRLVNHLRLMNHNIEITRTLNPNSTIYDEITSQQPSSNVPRTFRLEAIRLFQYRDRALEEREMLMADARSAASYFLDELWRMKMYSESDLRLQAHLHYKAVFILSQVEQLSEHFKINIPDFSHFKEYFSFKKREFTILNDYSINFQECDDTDDDIIFDDFEGDIGENLDDMLYLQ